MTPEELAKLYDMATLLRAVDILAGESFSTRLRSSGDEDDDEGSLTDAAKSAIEYGKWYLSGELGHEDEPSAEVWLRVASLEEVVDGSGYVYRYRLVCPDGSELA